MPVEYFAWESVPLEVMSEAWLDTTDGLQSDNWKARGSSRTPDGSANPDAQLTLISARVAAAVAVSAIRALAFSAFAALV